MATSHPPQIFSHSSATFGIKTSYFAYKTQQKCPGAFVAIFFSFYLKKSLFFGITWCFMSLFTAENAENAEVL
jgi:hypothetical protein